jgi:hypothetical protein
MTGELRPLWVCPRCGSAFVNRNSWHSCGRWPLDSHFVDRPKARSVRLWITHPVDSPRVVKLEEFAPETFVVTVELREPADVDAELRALLAEACAVGDQQHARQRRRYEASSR